MKKYLYLGFCLLCVFCAGCSDDNEEVIQEEIVKVISNDAEFDAYGGQATIEVESALPISASSEAEWCQVNVAGLTITVTVGENTSVESRTTRVIISAGDATKLVPVYQLGDAFSCDLSDFQFPSGGGTYTCSFHSTREVEVGELPEWITYRIEGNQVSFTAAATEVDRQAKVAVICGSNAISGTFSQRSRLDLEGNYNLYYSKELEGEEFVGTAVVAAGNEAGTYHITVKDMILNTVYKVSYDVEKRLLEISPQFLGYAGDYAAMLCVYTEDGYLSWGTDLKYIANGRYDENGKKYFEFEDSGTYKDKIIRGLYFACFDKPAADGGTYQKRTWGKAVDVRMVEQ